MKLAGYVLPMAVAVLSVPLVAAAPPGAGEWETPPCRTVVGSASVTYTTDEGATLAPNNLFMDPNTYTFGVVALKSPNLMLAEYGGTILRSTNAGCRWSSFAEVGLPLLRFAAGQGGVAYAWSFQRGYPWIWRVDAEADARDPGRLVSLSPLPADVLVVAADPGDPAHLRAVGADAQIYDSFDGGSRWGATGIPAPMGSFSLVYFAAFDPADLDHVIVGMSTTGAWTTFDGGASWIQAAGLSKTGGPRNTFNGVFSPADPAEVFVMGIDLDEADAGAPSEGRHIYRSQDGGLTFAPVVDRGGDIVLINGPLLVAHPSTPGVLYFTYGSRFLYPAGTYLYRYDHATGQTTWNFTTETLGIRAIDFNPADTGVMYLGLEN